MLERFEEMLEKLKAKKANELMTFSLETVIGYFEMQDINKFLKFNSITEEQFKRTSNIEQHIQDILKKLYVPDYQSKNV